MNEMTPSNIPFHEKFWSRERTAAELGRSVRTLDRWHALKFGPPRIKIGKLILYPVAALIEFLNKNASKDD